MLPPIHLRHLLYSTEINSIEILHDTSEMAMPYETLHCIICITLHKLKTNVDFHCRRCLEGEHGLFQSVLLKEVVMKPNVKVECVPKFCYLGDTFGAEGGLEEAARARVRCAWAKFKELSPILTALGASYRIKGKIYKACVQIVLTYGTWAMKKANLHSLERTEWMMVRWMCGVSLKDRKCNVDLYSLLGVQCDGCGEAW